MFKSCPRNQATPSCICFRMPSSSIEVVDLLFRKMNELVPSSVYPGHVLQITERINGTAFFPGGCGLYCKERDRDEDDFPFGGAMILGHNFDSEAGFKKSLENGEETLTSGTWQSILDKPDCEFSDDLVQNVQKYHAKYRD